MGYKVLYPLGLYFTFLSLVVGFFACKFDKFFYFYLTYRLRLVSRLKSCCSLVKVVVFLQEIYPP
ncbi:hypothetical protein OIU76_025363 [Salix suchowensis]|uniref:Uncharacterized protein n=1 Tax=Salix suchowensis TaxID=1278906 RepID=A0ABQ9B0M6_9ROSI|nr:hypothetical protein OIU76_025363 [Salix suchowensis]KAJ6366649.1 hypothetical protein OIU77_003100 [Salix suchowensis]